MAAKKDNELEDYFVGIDAPIDVRRNILEASKDSISLLKQHAILKEIKEEKDELTAQYKKTVSDINSLMAQLKTQLPKVKITKHKAKAKAAKKTVKKTNAKPAPQPVKEKKRSELDILEEQLSSVEEQLKSLN